MESPGKRKFDDYETEMGENLGIDEKIPTKNLKISKRTRFGMDPCGGGSAD